MSASTGAVSVGPHGLLSERHGFACGHVVARPESLEQVKPEVFAYRFLDHFAVTFSGTGGATLTARSTTASSSVWSAS
ncbi:MAG: hypothetical protein M3488_01580 [Actinomycetota bacterium]|nr:hypothetical protein [Actinomycetota bacterium]